MDTLFKVVGAALFGVFCILLIRDKTPNMSFAVSAVVCIVISGVLLPTIRNIYDRCTVYMQIAGIDADIAAPLFKVVAIALITRLVSELCNEQGLRAISFKIELFGTATGILCAAPLIEKALIMIGAI